MRNYNPPEFSLQAAEDLATLVAAGPAGSVAAGTGIGVSTVDGVSTVSNDGVLVLTVSARVSVSNSGVGDVTIDTIGFSGTVASPTSITVVDGIVTAVS